MAVYGSAGGDQVDHVFRILKIVQCVPNAARSSFHENGIARILHGLNLRLAEYRKKYLLTTGLFGTPPRT
jgi:hypothetical protein